MSDGSSYEDAASRLASQSAAVGRLAQDSGAFAAVVAAFESEDTDAFRWVLERVEMLPYCELICDWVRVKLGVLRCIEVCGVPRENTPTPSFQDFARAVVDLASNEKLSRRVVDAVACGDGDAYRAAVAELKLEEFCGLLCHWVYSVIYDRVCEVVCSPQRLPLPDAVSEVRAAGREIAGLVENTEAIDAISKAAVALNCETLRSAINAAGLISKCEIICRLVCSWRCVWVCREVCEVRSPVLSGAAAIEEARNFALASRQIGTQPRVLTDLVTAVQNGDAKAYSEIISRYGLGPYCYQICAWVCAETCHEVCRCVCPPAATQALFTLVGNFAIYSQINPTSGLTSTKLPVTLPQPYGGGPNFAFYNELQLGGSCPTTSPISPGTAMMFRFLYAKVLTTLASAISSASQTSISVASSAGVSATPFNVSVCYTDGLFETSEIMTVNSVSGTTWTVVRGVDGTTAAAAIAAGAVVGISPTPITGSLVDTPVQVGQRPITWPTNVGGLAGPSGPTLEPVYVGYGTDPTAPAAFAPYIAPAHYLKPDFTTGWVELDATIITPFIQTFLNFDSAQVTPGPCELTTGPCIGNPGGAPAGTAVPAANQGAGTDLSIIFQATRVGFTTVDYSNSLCRIHVNNWSEVNNLWFLEFTTGSEGCCTPIVASLNVQFTVDHEEMNSGGWGLEITSCSPSAPGAITPAASSVGPPPVTVTPRGGWGTVVEDTSAWTDCSYIVTLTTRPGLTTGLYDREEIDNQLTFCICGG